MTVFVFWIDYTVAVPCWKLMNCDYVPSMKASLHLPIDLSRDLCCVCIYIRRALYL